MRERWAERPLASSPRALASVIPCPEANPRAQKGQNPAGQAPLRLWQQQRVCVNSQPQRCQQARWAR